MSHSTFARPMPWMVLVVVTIILSLLSVVGTTSPHRGASSSASSLPTPTPQTGLSIEARMALAYVSEQEGISAEELIVVGEFPRESALLGRTFQAITLRDRQSGRFFKVLVDIPSRQVEDRATVEAAEDEVFRARYGKLQPALHERLQGITDEERATVTIWVVAEPGKILPEAQAAAFAALADRYPQAAAAMERGRKPMEVEDRELAERIYDEYVEILDAGVAWRIRPLVQALEAQGFAVRTAQGLPAVNVTLPKSAILGIADRDDVGTIYLSEGEGRLGLDAAVPTNRAPLVWARGIEGIGVEIAVVETDNVDFTPDGNEQCPDVGNNCFKNPGDFVPAIDEVDWHATLVASAAASYHAAYRGMAYGATISSIGMQGTSMQDGIEALTTSLALGADVVNLSIGWCTTNTEMTDIDRAFDWYARTKFRLFVILAHNDSVCGNHIVASPGKAWNVLTVGAYDDDGDADWANDVMADFSCYLNPDGGSEKPEVVAPGVAIRGIEMDGNDREESGTSFAAPQVAGLAALLFDRDWNLSYWPEATRAIIMASASHNIVGPDGIPYPLLDDLHDGAGAINALLADTVAQTRPEWDASCTENSCWWARTINNAGFPVETYLYHEFIVRRRGSLVRVVIAWNSNADCPSIDNCNFDQLDTDLDLEIEYWNEEFGAWEPVPGARSASWDHSYEMVDFRAPRMGTYRIASYKCSATEDENYLAIALTQQFNVFLPGTMRNYLPVVTAPLLPTPPVRYPDPQIPAPPSGYIPPPTVIPRPSPTPTE